MSYSIITVSLKYEDDVVAARQRGRQIAGLLGFDSLEQTRIATAVSEIARNAFRYAGGGLVEFLVEGQTAPQILLVRVTDSGPGIPDLAKVLEGRYHSSTGMGLGMIGARRLMDQCDVRTEPGKGTTVCLKKLLPKRARLFTATELQYLVDALTRQSPQNAQEEVRQQNHELLKTLDELRARQEDLVRVNQELEDTNRGVVALYAELDEKAEHLRRADQMKTGFLSNMSHEFRTPVSSILALSALLLERADGELTDEQDKQVRFIRKGAESLLELVNDLLDLAKIEAGKVVVRPVEFDIKNMFSALRGMLKPLLATTSVNLVFDEPEGFPPLYTDEGKVSQVLRNFLSNALKFTERGEIRVTATMDREGDRITLAVADTGIGIAPGDQTRIFEEFTQLDSPMQRRVKGTGLGLPLCRKLAILLGGNVSVESRVGIGSVFQLTIPVQCRVVDSHEAVDGSEEPWTLDPGLLPVLVIEDEPQTRFVYEKFLRGTRYQPLPAAGLRQADHILSSTRPAAIVLDILLAGEESWQWLARTKADPSTRDIPILVATTVEDQAKGLSLGADAYCVKPLDRQRLVEELGRLTGSTPVSDVPPIRKDLPSILIIDDEEPCRYVLSRLLLDSSCTVLEAKDGSEGLRLCQTMRPDLIFLDLNMPGVSGWDMITEIAALPDLREVPIVIVTAQSLSDESRSSLERRTHSILMKNELSEETIRRVVNETVFARRTDARSEVSS